MPYVMKQETALKIYHLAVDYLGASKLGFRVKHGQDPSKILEEYLARIGSWRFLETLRTDTEIMEEVSKILASMVDFREWPDMLNGYQNVIAASREDLLTWVLDSVRESFPSQQREREV